MAPTQHQCNTCKRVYASEQDYLRETRRWRLCTEGHLWFNCSCGSTLLLKKGHFPWYSPQIFLSVEAKSVFNSLSSLADLPRLPSAVMELQLTLDRTDVTPREIAGALKHEPFLAAQVLTIAENLRNARNPYTTPIKALEHAIVYIGYKVLSDTLLTAALHSIPLPKSSFKPSVFWRESYLVGLVAEFLARRLSTSLVADEVFLAGSLCNIGKLVTAFCFPQLAGKITREISPAASSMSWRQAEEKYEAPEHTILGEIAASMWGLPEYVFAATRRHHEVPGNNRWPHAELTALTAAANQFVHINMKASHLVEPEILQGFQQWSKLSSNEFDVLNKEVSDFYRSLTKHS